MGKTVGRAEPGILIITSSVARKEARATLAALIPDFL
jgi:hypothetical protein